MPVGKHLSELATLVDGVTTGEGDPLIVDVTHRSGDVSEGSLFVALVGANSDGHDYIDDAVVRGAEAIVVQRPVTCDVPVLLVEDTRQVLGPLASSVHGYPSREVEVVGVTGTNGKTTITHFVESMVRHQGRKSGLIGTINVKVGDHAEATAHTTPEASEFQRLLARMRDAGVEVVAAEVSSHALEFGRVNGTQFSAGVFTNLSQDHLDFHGTMEVYGAAKRRLFTEHPIGTAIVNIDDPVGADIASSYPGDLVTVGLIGDVNFSDISPILGGTRFRLTSPWGEATVEAPIVGDFNVANLTMAAATCIQLSMSFEEVVDAMGHVDQVPGRFEVVSGDDAVAVIVDYAHTPESVRRAIEAGRLLVDGRVIALLGAGGDRDREKRPKMGEALAAADFAVVTTDNPRSEDPAQIAQAVAAGVGETPLHVELDRREAIRFALEQAVEGDLVLLLGRGHEPLQDLGDRKIEFDDRNVAVELLGERRMSTNLGDESGSMSP